jgi:hypothetical protein
VTTTRIVRDDVKNTLDYLVDGELALYANEVSITGTQVSFHRHQTDRVFLNSHQHPTIGQYRAWIAAGAYSAVLFDGALLQITYDVNGGRISGHRLAYIPCPYDIDISLLATGEPVADIVDLYRDEDAAFRSPIRFDFDPRAAKAGHPAVHMTFNGSDCRIGCIAPVHVLRFTDFVFRHFYASLWAAHRPFFAASAWRHVGQASMDTNSRRTPHLMWDVHATATG